MKNYIIVAIERFFIIFFKLISLILLMRFLTVEDMGVIAVLNIYIGISVILIDSGFSGAFLRKNEISKQDYDFLYTNVLILSILIYTISIISAYFFENLKNINGLFLYVCILMSFVFLKVKNIVFTLHFLHKQNFKEIAKVNNISQFISFIILFLMLLSGFKIFSFIFQILIEAILINILLRNKIILKNNINFKYKNYIEEIKIAYSTLFSSLIRTSYDNLVSIFILNQYGLRNLGLYAQANKVNTLFITSFMGVVDKVTFVKYTKISDKNTIGVFNKISTIVIFSSFIILFGIITSFENIIIKFFNKEWLGMVDMINYIAAIAFLSAADLNIRSLIKAKFKHSNIILNEIYKKSVGLIFILLFYLFEGSIIDFLFILVLISFVSVAISFIMVVKYTNYNLIFIVNYIFVFILTFLLMVI